MFLWRTDKNYPSVIIKCPPYLFFCMSYIPVIFFPPERVSVEISRYSLWVRQAKMHFWKGIIKHPFSSIHCWVMGLLSINFRLFITYGPWIKSEFHFRSISWEWMNGFWPNFACQSSLGLLSVHFHQFITELSPLLLLIAINILFTLDIFRNMNLAYITYSLFCGYALGGCIK